MPKKSHDDVLSQLAELHDRNLLRIVKRGKFTTIGADGDPIEIDLTAAMLNAITNRLKACNVTVSTKPGSTMGEIEKELESKGLKLADHLPDHDFEDDAATA